MRLRGKRLDAINAALKNGTAHDFNAALQKTYAQVEGIGQFAEAPGLEATRLEHFTKIKVIIESGYAGVMPNGNIVDRRVEKSAIPIPANSMFGTPEPKPLNL